jgi:hypothetical protein
MAEMQMTGRARRKPGDEGVGGFAQAGRTSAFGRCRNLLDRANADLAHFAFKKRRVLQHREIDQYFLPDEESLYLGLREG